MRCSKLFTAVILCSAYSVLAAEENPITMPAMPAPPSIEMPSVNTPTMGGSFYTPGKIYTGRKNLPTAPKAAAPEEQHTQSAQSVLPAAKANTENANKTFAQLSSAFGGTDYLSAADIQSLGQNGLFSGVYGLLGGAKSNFKRKHEYTFTKYSYGNRKPEKTTEQQEYRHGGRIRTVADKYRKFQFGDYDFHSPRNSAFCHKRLRYSYFLQDRLFQPKRDRRNVFAYGGQKISYRRKNQQRNILLFV